MGAPLDVVGRQAELANLNALIDGSQRPPVVVLAGAPGMGKTTLWTVAVNNARHKGWTVLAARPSGAETSLSFAGLSDLFGAVGEETLSRIPSVQRKALEIALLRSEPSERGEPGDDGVDARTVSAGVLSVLQQLGSTTPVLVAVDDIATLDRATASALSFALRRLEGSSVVLLASIREDDTRARALIGAVAGDRGAEVLLRPMAPPSVRRILDARFSDRMSRHATTRVAAACGGNPFYAIEIAHELLRQDQRVGPGPLPVPGELRQLLTARVNRLPAPARESLLAVSCMGDAHANVVGASGLRRAEEAGLVTIDPDGRARFTHPLLAAAVYESASPGQRRSVHRMLADRLEDAEERARHLALGAEGPDIEIAGQLDEAAKLAQAHGSPAAAAELVELALQLTPADVAPGRAERMCTGAALHFEAGDLGRAQELVEQALSEPLGNPLRASALRLLAQLRSRRGTFAEAAQLALEALSSAPGELALEVGLHLDLVFYYTSLADFPGALPQADAAVAAAEALGHGPLEAEALAVRTVVQFLCGAGLSSQDLSRALTLEDPQRSTLVLFRARFISALVQLWTGRASDAAARLDDMRAEALELGRESEAPLTYLYLVWAHLWSGDMARARDEANEARQTARHLDDRAASALAFSAGALAAAYAGNEEEVRVCVEKAMQLFAQMGWHSGIIWPSWALGFLELSLGHHAAAVAALVPLSDMLGDMSAVDPVIAVFLPDEIEALVGLGEVGKARELLGFFERRAAALGRGWALAVAARCRGLVHAELGELDAALNALEESRRAHEALELPFERARCVLEIGRVQRRRKQKRLAREALLEAAQSFALFGTPLWATRAEAELKRVNVRRAPSGLTPTEESIAMLAAQGLSNRAIAQRSFVSVKTVEANLGRVYRKLGITSRPQLVRALDQVMRAGP